MRKWRVVPGIAVSWETETPNSMQTARTRVAQSESGRNDGPEELANILCCHRTVPRHPVNGVGEIGQKDN